MQNSLNNDPGGGLNIQRNILAIDDSLISLRLLKKIVNKMGHNIILAGNGLDGLDLALKQQPDLILLGVMMPEMDGYEVCRRLKANPQTRDIPVIFVSAKDHAQDRIIGLEIGAIDYINKPYNADEMRVRIDIIFQMARMREELTSQAYFDELTGLMNRRRFREIMDAELRCALRENQPLSLIMVDIDHFKAMNDTYGHLGGDIVLRQVADILKDNMYEGDIVARYGGEEFVILMPNTTCEKAAAACERIRSIIKNTQWQISAEDFVLTISMGLDTIDAHSPAKPQELIQRADAALYTAKEQGRNRVVRWDHIDITQEDFLLNYDEYHDIENEINDLAQILRIETGKKIGQLIGHSLKEKDPDRVNDLSQVQCYMQHLIEALNLDETTAEKILQASQLYNLGKISIPNRIFNKSSQITGQERQIIEQWPLISLRLLEPLGIFEEQLPIIRHRNENFDGTGHPKGLKGQQIPYGSRILAVVDSFNAMTSLRPYQEPLTLIQALEELEKCAGTQFDPDIVLTFIRVAEEHKNDWPLATQPQLETC